MNRLYFSLSPRVLPRHLESYFVYHALKDELYEVDGDGWRFFLALGESPVAPPEIHDQDLLYCLREGLITLSPSPNPTPLNPEKSSNPSLRYLELQLTRRCNLRCRHCYLGESSNVDLPLQLAESALQDFERGQGLRLLISGGEPLLYPSLDEFNRLLSSFAFRKVLLTNANLLTPPLVGTLAVDEYRVSLDGLEMGHDSLRGPGSFERALKGIEAARSAGMDLSISTMIHRGNLNELEEMAGLVRDLGAREWDLDVAADAGRQKENPLKPVSPGEAGPFLALSYGGSYHGSTEGQQCGLHLCTISPEGLVAKCGFYFDQPAGRLDEGLQTVWKRIPHPSAEELECAGCPWLADCGGGCRYRAPWPRGKDPMMCALYDWRKGKRTTYIR